MRQSSHTAPHNKGHTRGQGALHGGAAPGRRAAVLPVDPVQLSISPWEAAATGRRGQGGAEGRSHRAAVGGSDRQRQRGCEPPGCSRRKAWRVLRSGDCLPGGGWGDSAPHGACHHGSSAAGGGRVLPEPSTTSGWTHRHPDGAIWCAEPHRPPGVLWEHLDQDKITEVPALAALVARR
jgi:hypothetical protein